jgi:hypothetical protein
VVLIKLAKTGDAMANNIKFAAPVSPIDKYKPKG